MTQVPALVLLKPCSWRPATKHFSEMNTRVRDLAGMGLGRDLREAFARIWCGSSIFQMR